MQPSRRQVLTAGAVALASACTSDRSPRPPAPDPDLALVEAAVAREETLVAALAGLLRAHPSLAPRLAPLLSDHTAHLAALRPAPPGTSTPLPSPVAPVTPAALRALERQTASAHAAAATTASRALAPLLASLAACEASHAAVLA